MATIACTNCGAGIEGTAKFCRQCGQPVNLSEATTRNLEAHSEYEALTRNINPADTSPTYTPPSYTPPAYMSQAEMFQQPTPTTKGLQSSGQQKVLWIIAGSMVVFLLVALSGLAFFLTRMDTQPVPDRDIPSFTEIPGHPPIPPIPPPPPGGTIDANTSALIYPGAEVVMDMRRGEGGRVLQLKTKDRGEEVVDWYVEKLRPTKNIRIPGGNTILQAGDTTAIIISDGRETNITIKLGLDD